MILSLNPCFASVKPHLKSVHAAKDGLQSPSWVCGENKGKPEHSSVYVYSIKSICINKDLKLSKKNKNKKNAISVTEELNL